MHLMKRPSASCGGPFLRELFPLFTSIRERRSQRRVWKISTQSCQRMKRPDGRPSGRIKRIVALYLSTSLCYLEFLLTLIPGVGRFKVGYASADRSSRRAAYVKT
jgi:hypothetical protein